MQYFIVALAVILIVVIVVMNMILLRGQAKKAARGGRPREERVAARDNERKDAKIQESVSSNEQELNQVPSADTAQGQALGPAEIPETRISPLQDERTDSNREFEAANRGQTAYEAVAGQLDATRDVLGWMLWRNGDVVAGRGVDQGELSSATRQVWDDVEQLAKAAFLRRPYRLSLEGLEGSIFIGSWGFEHLLAVFLASKEPELRAVIEDLLNRHALS